jgi:hypothetical protein
MSNGARKAKNNELHHKADWNEVFFSSAFITFLRWLAEINHSNLVRVAYYF